MNLRNKIQEEAINAWINTPNLRGIFEMTMRSGKTIAALRAVGRAIELGLLSKDTHVLFSAETEARYNTLQEELLKFKALFDYPQFRVDFSIYTGNNRFEEVYDKNLVVIVDEIHDCATGVYSNLLKKSKDLPFIGLSGTLKEDTIISTESDSSIIQGVNVSKKMVYSFFDLPVVYSYTMEQAIEDGLWPRFDFITVEHELDDKSFYKIGKKGRVKEYKYTEREYYTHLMNTSTYFKAIGNTNAMVGTMRRAYGVLYGCPSKVRLAEKIASLENKSVLIINKHINGVGFTYPLVKGESLKKEKDARTKLINDFLSGKQKVIVSSKFLSQGISLKTPQGVSIIMVSYDSKGPNFEQKAARALLKDGEETPRIWCIVTKNTREEDWYRSAAKRLRQLSDRQFTISSRDVIAAGQLSEVLQSEGK